MYSKSQDYLHAQVDHYYRHQPQLVKQYHKCQKDRKAHNSITTSHQKNVKYDLT